MVPDRHVPPGRPYWFRATLYSWVGGTAITAEVVVNKASMEPPTVSFPGGVNEVSVKREDALSIPAAITPSACDGAAVLSFRWSLIDTGGPVVYIDELVQTSSTLYLPPLSLIPGEEYLFEVRVTADAGGGATADTARNLTVRVAQVPVPALVSATYVVGGDAVDGTEDDRGIELFFDLPTDQASMYIGSPCSAILSANTLALLGGGTTSDLECTWANSQLMQIRWTGTGTFGIGAPIRVKDGVLRSAGGFSAYAQVMRADLKGPAVASVPQVIISAPSLIGSCDGVVLGSEGSGGSAGRPFRASWSLVERVDSPLDSIELAKLQTLLGAGASVELPSSSLPTGPYTFRLTLTNWLNESSSATHELVKSAAALPKVLLSPPPPPPPSPQCYPIQSQMCRGLVIVIWNSSSQDSRIATNSLAHFTGSWWLRVLRSGTPRATKTPQSSSRQPARSAWARETRLFSAGERHPSLWSH